MPSPAAHELVIEHDAPIPTWFEVGGHADRLARPASPEDVRRCLELDPRLRVLGDGANLLVDDAGVGELVVAFTDPGMSRATIDPATGFVHAMAGAKLPRLVTDTVRQGLGGLEGLGGIPATLGGAMVMNAGGSFGQIADVVVRVHAMDRRGRELTLERSEIGFGYRRSGLGGLVLLSAELRLEAGDPAALRGRLKEVMAYKAGSQPMANKSAGCAFKNPTITSPVKGLPEGQGEVGSRVSAGMLIDLAGCKGLRVGGAEVSRGHANFLVTHPGATASDVIRLMEEVERRVLDRFGVRLEREVVVWRRDQG